MRATRCLHTATEFRGSALRQRSGPAILDYGERARGVAPALRGVYLGMRAIQLLVGTCLLALLVAGCGASLGPEDEGLELLPAAALPTQPEPPPSETAEEPPGLTEEDLAEEDVAAEPDVEPEARPVNPFSEAVRLLLRGRSARIAVTATSSLPNGAEFRVLTDGTFDVRAHVGAAGVDGGNLVRMLGDQGAIALGFVPSDLVFTQRDVFLHYEDLPETVPGQLPWADASFKQLTGRPQWPDQGAVSALALTTPAHVAAFLTSARKTLVEIGNEPVRGASSTHYQGVADLSKTAAAAPALMRGALRGQMRALAASLGTAELPIDVWLDAKGRLRRVQIDLGATAEAAQAASDVEASTSEATAPKGETTQAEQPAADEPAAQPSASDGEPTGQEDSATETPENASGGEEAVLEPPAGVEGVETTSEDQAAPVGPKPPNTLLVIDFISFSGRVRAGIPGEEETAPYPQVAALARGVGASLSG